MATTIAATLCETGFEVVPAPTRKLPDNVRWLSRAVRVSARHTGQVLGRGLLDHYRSTLVEIRDTGYVRYWSREFKPYLAGALRQFSPKQATATERLLRWRRQRAGGRQNSGKSEANSSDT